MYACVCMLPCQWAGRAWTWCSGYSFHSGTGLPLCLTVEQKREAVQQRQAEGLFIDHLWPTWQQEGDDDKERNYGGQGRANKKIGHPTRMK